MSATPIVKWAGGKTRLLPRLRAVVPSRFRRYYEPFMGGAALFFALAPERAVLGDSNAGLVRTYQAVGAYPDRVIRALRQHKSAHSDEDYFYRTRDLWNNGMAGGEAKAYSDVEVAAAFIYLNKTCFNGLWRVNKSGAFNVPRGDYKDPAIVDAENIQAASAVLSRADIRHAGFEETVADASEGDFAYLDPPYDPLTRTSSFTAYAGAFGRDQQRKLAELARDLDARGVFVVASNNDTPFVRELYQTFDISTAACGRSINSKATGRGKVNELLITSRRT